MIDEVNSHDQLRDHGELLADAAFHRSELVEPASRIPREWVTGTCAIGSVDACVAQLQRFRDAGADEIVTYGSTPRQNEQLARAWAARTVPVA
ncbi:MAG TPA: hypothetical protein VD931_01220 [Baekduia sp.]|nr:hypothetical protein [Baekduia sp.]